MIRVSTLGGLGSIIGGIFGFSDRRLKRDIQRIGQLPNGLPVYRFRYIWSDQQQIGLMADEVARIHPEAVRLGPGGFKMVNYAMAVLPAKPSDPKGLPAHAQLAGVL